MRHACEKGKRYCWRCWWFTISFPVEHFIWEKAPLFSNLARAMGL